MARFLFLALAMPSAQPVYAQPVPPVVTMRVELAAGTSVHFVTVDELTSKRQHKGDQIALKTLGDTLVDGRIVIPANSVAVGVISDSRGTGGFGVSGKLWLSPLYISLGGVTVRFTGQTLSGRGVQPATVIGIAILGAMVSGNTALVPAGTPIDGMVMHTVSVPVAMP